MNLTFLANCSSINCGLRNNGSLGLNRDNKTGVFGETGFQFLWLLYAAYVIIFLASIFGNSVIIHIIRTDNSMKTVTNYLILNQACADLLMTVTYLVSSLIPYSLGLGSRWFGGLLGQITCKVFVVFIFFPPFFSQWILVAIAVERYYAVTRLLQSSPISRHLKKIIVLLWAWSAVSSTDVLANELLVKSKQYYYCNFMTKWITFQILSAALNTALSSLIMAVLYAIVCYKLWSRKIPGEGANQNQGQAEAMKTARKVTEMMIMIVLLFILCWFPYNISVVLHFWGDTTTTSSFVLFFIWLMVAYSGINPCIYLTFNQKFRHAFKRLFRNCFRKIKIRNVVHFRSQSFDLEQM
ncbi:substance-P receptor-like [Oculina patagonica]